jgi:broad specificity phosphatase PhoE
VSDCVWLLRHGATEWTDEGRHTGREDVPLSEVGRDQARRAGRYLADRPMTHVFVSPQTRALETCRLAGFGDRAQRREELVEWDYGDYEGMTDEETQRAHPGWDLFRDGCPGGERPDQVAARVDRLLETVRGTDGTCLLVGHGKSLRALAARWVQRDVALGSVLPMDPAAISLLGHESAGPLLQLWNFTGEQIS